MAFFGITNLGYQNPIGDQMITPRGAPCTQVAGLIPNMGAHGWPHLTPGALTPSISPTAGTPTLEGRNSTERWSNGFRYRHVSSGNPNQLYRVPLTDNQRYGWSVTKTEGPEPWTQMKRFPRQNSEMTNFVKAMMLTDPDFSLF
ncbi:testis-expressed protein 49-like [Gadus chalcogrammus]|uniref:testis-expressed protein 49-like n=1 Tax=Gadus chalcogrammus TaxID=1042646 RepID=UPI0024C42C8A|nr:testis-expressed protein 49-like [Gadus chalcogrammus]